MIPLTKEEIDEDIPLCFEILDEIEQRYEINVNEVRASIKYYLATYYRYKENPKLVMKRLIVFYTPTLDVNVLCSEESLQLVYSSFKFGSYDSLFVMPIKILPSDFLRCQLECKSNAKIKMITMGESNIRHKLLEKSFKLRKVDLLDNIKQMMIGGNCPMSTITLKFIDKKIDVQFQSCFLMDKWFNIETKEMMSDKDENILTIQTDYNDRIVTALISWFSSGSIDQELTDEEIDIIGEMADMHFMDDLLRTMRHLKNLDNTLMLQFGITMEIEHYSGNIYLIKFNSKNDNSFLVVTARKKSDEEYEVDKSETCEYLRHIFGIIKIASFVLSNDIQEGIMNTEIMKESIKAQKRMARHYGHEGYRIEDYLTPLGFYRRIE